MALEQQVKQRVDGVIQRYWVNHSKEQQERVAGLRKEALAHISEDGDVSGDIETLLSIDPGRTASLIKDGRNGVVRNSAFMAFMSFENDPQGEIGPVIPASEARFIGRGERLRDGTIVGRTIVSADNTRWRIEQKPGESPWLCVETLDAEEGVFQPHSELDDDILTEFEDAEADADSSVLTWKLYQEQAERTRKEWAEEEDPSPREVRYEDFDDDYRRGRDDDRECTREDDTPTTEFEPVSEPEEGEKREGEDWWEASEDKVFRSPFGAPFFNDGGYVCWPETPEASTVLLHDFNTSSGCKRWLNEYGYSRSPDGYPGEYIIHGVNVTTPQQQQCIDILCREADLREQYRDTLRNPFTDPAIRNRERNSYMAAKADAKVIRRAFNQTDKALRWEQKLEKNPLLYGALGTGISGSRVATQKAKNVASRYWNWQKERKRDQREQRREYYDNLRNQRRRGKRGRRSFMRRVLIGGLKMKFLSKFLR